MCRSLSISYVVSSVLLLFLYSVSILKLAWANDTVRLNQGITYNQTLVSSMGTFELGFFSPGASGKWYVGIWYKSISDHTVVWVANREAPLRDKSSGILIITRQPAGIALLNETNQTIWISNSTKTTARDPILQLLDSGNLVLREAANDDPQDYLWESFDHPTDTFLPGMTLGPDYGNSSSWKSEDDPAPGEYILYMNNTGYSQLFLKKSGVIQYRLGPWNGLVLSGQHVRNDPAFTFGVYKNEEGKLFLRYDALDMSVLARVTLNTAGMNQRWRWADRTQQWVAQMRIPPDICDVYNRCGAYGRCVATKHPSCECLDKFLPKVTMWTESDWSSHGCVRRTPLNCLAGDGFVKYTYLKLPDAGNSWYDERMTLEECRMECLRNCSCTAFTTLNISRKRSGCLIWFGDLIDMRHMSINDQDLYIRMASSEVESTGKKRHILSLTILGMVLLCVSMLLCIWKRKKDRDDVSVAASLARTDREDLELPLFHLSAILKVTNHFSVENKIGEGGYGPVYKGTLIDGQEIAVKRLSKTSKQGLDEFKNEVILVSKLQHRNLVKLLGCCIEREEKMLIYEYMPNKSLDRALFDKKEVPLSWSTRVGIVHGIARGLVYLHQDSRLRIIHRDLKASNILLDGEMNPKISDFGIAKRNKGNETEDMTNRVVGTYGYMSPEYAVCGRFSEKSDVFSFGVIVLEIVSGKRNSSYTSDDGNLNFLGHAWTIHKEGRSLELVDDYVDDLDRLGEVLRVIHVGLLCVQQHPYDRPTMSKVVAMLSNTCELPQPNHPGFYSERSCILKEFSTNEVTITMITGR